MPQLSPESAYAIFTAKHPTATREETFQAAWQLATVRSPEASADENDACFRRNLGLRIQNLTVSAKGELTWLAIECKGVVQSLYPRADAVRAAYLPCPICNGTEGCDHSVPERKRAAEQPIYQSRVEGFEAAWRDVSKECYEAISQLSTYEARIVYAAPVAPGAVAPLSAEAQAFYARHEARMGRVGPQQTAAQPDERTCCKGLAPAHECRVECGGTMQVRATTPQSTHYQELISVAYVVLGCLAANGIDIPKRFLDAFSDPDSVEKPLELLPCDFLPAQAVRAGVEGATLTDEQRKLIEAAADCISEAVTYEQDGFDTPPGPATQWDYNADQLAYALRGMLRAGKEGA